MFIRLIPCFLAAALVGAFVWPGTLPSEAKRTRKKAEVKVPAALIRWPESNSEYAILVDKATQKVLVYRTQDLTRPVRTYRCSTGENRGPKTRQNDKKTPEGIYFFTGAYGEQELTPIYGTRAFPVDYPNPLDRKEGKDGYGIWFHGTNKPLKPNDTNGCIALENGNIDTLAKYIELNDTPTVISSKLEMVDPVTLEKERVALELLVEGWRSSWESERIDEYMSFYGNAFHAKGMDRDSWRDYKRRLSQKYPWIRVEIDNLRLLRHNGTVLAKFNQHYKSPSFDSYGEKRLYLRRNSEEWKIVGEYFSAVDERSKKQRPPKPDPSILIQGLMARWERAWESEDIRAYMACYDPSFRSRGMDVRAWERHRKKLNRTYRSIQVEIQDLEIQMVGENKAKVTFKQDYRADDYRDYGLKELLLIKRGDTWKIKEEEWKALEGNPA
ncbi:MAG: L,D-transpeptidase family protein [Desulfobacteraceae bacterium]